MSDSEGDRVGGVRRATGGMMRRAGGTCEHEVHSVEGPSGPVLLLPQSCPLHSHHEHRQLPPSQKRRCPPSELMLAKLRPQKSHAYSPLSFCQAEGGK